MNAKNSSETMSLALRAEAAFEAVYYKGPWPFINRAWGKVPWQLDEGYSDMI